jgi:predicted RNase H-like HicB family nuclease
MVRTDCVGSALTLDPTYIAVIEKEPDSAFGVWFPDVEGCFSAGDTLDEAVANAAAALRQHAEATESASRRVPPACSIDEVRLDDDVAAAVEGGAVLLTVPLAAAAESNTGSQRHLPAD